MSLSTEARIANQVKALFTLVEEAPDQESLDNLAISARLESTLAQLEHSAQALARFSVALNQLAMAEIPSLPPHLTFAQIRERLREAIAERFESRYWLHRPMLQNRPRGRLFPSTWRRSGRK